MGGGRAFQVGVGMDSNARGKEGHGKSKEVPEGHVAGAKQAQGRQKAEAGM